MCVTCMRGGPVRSEDRVFRSALLTIKQVASMNALCSILLVFSAMNVVAGCTTVSPPHGDFALIPVTTVHSSNIRVESAGLAEIEGRLTVTGRVRKLYRNPVGSIHLDVMFLGAQGKRIAMKTTTVRFSHSRIGPPPAARFSLTVEAWPEGTIEIVVSPHSDENHE